MLAFLVCTILLIIASNMAFNTNRDSVFYFRPAAVARITGIRHLASMGVVFFVAILNFAIHQLMIGYHSKCQAIADNMAKLETKIDGIDYAQQNRFLDYDSTPFQNISKKYGTVYVIYLACLTLLALNISAYIM
jgi:hypothetical protein